MNALVLWTIIALSTHIFYGTILLWHFYNIKNKKHMFKVSRKLYIFFSIFGSLAHISCYLISLGVFSSLIAISIFCLGIFTVFNTCFIRLKTNIKPTKLFYAFIIKYYIVSVCMNLVFIDLYCKFESMNTEFPLFYYPLILLSSFGPVISLSNCIFYLLYLNSYTLIALDMKVISQNCEEDCPVCLDSLKTQKSVETDCGHKYHVECINKAFETSIRCPMCRREFQMYSCL
jgi:hypothetical protein